MKKHGSKPGQAVFRGYPHIRGTVIAAEWQPSFIHLWPGIGCPDFLRPFEDTPPPSTIVALKYSYAHSGVAVGFFAPCARPRCRGPPPVSEICSQPNFRIRRNHIWALIMRQKRRSLKRCGQDSGVNIGRPGCPIPPSRRCMTSIGRYSNRRGSIAFIRRTWASVSLTSLPPSRRTSPH